MLTIFRCQDQGSARLLEGFSAGKLGDLLLLLSTESSVTLLRCLSLLQTQRWLSDAQVLCLCNGIALENSAC